jgi:hypothetical protein
MYNKNMFVHILSTRQLRYAGQADQLYSLISILLKHLNKKIKKIKLYSWFFFCFLRIDLGHTVNLSGSGLAPQLSGLTFIAL